MTVGHDHLGCPHVNPEVSYDGIGFACTVLMSHPHILEINASNLDFQGWLHFVRSGLGTAKNETLKASTLFCLLMLSFAWESRLFVCKWIDAEKSLTSNSKCTWQLESKEAVQRRTTRGLSWWRKGMYHIDLLASELLSVQCGSFL